MEGHTSTNVSDSSEGTSILLQDPVGSPAMVASKLIVGSVGVVGNVLVVVVVIKYKQLFQHIKTTFIVNQSAIDGIVSLLLIMTTFVSPQLHSDVDGLSVELYCKLWLSHLPIWGLMTSSTYNLMAISTERYLAIVHPIWHKVSFTKIMADSIAVLIWFFGVFYVASVAIPTTGMLREHCFTLIFSSRAIARVVAFVQIIVNMVMPISVHSFCYTRILSALRKRTRIVASDDGTSTSTTQMWKTGGIDVRPATETGVGHLQIDESNVTRATVSLPSTSSRPTNATTNWKSNASTEQSSRSSDKRHNPLEKQNEKAKRNVAKTLAIVTACYFICWLPNQIYVILYLTGVIPAFGDIFGLTVILAFINCCINPIIYIGKYDAFRTGLSLLFRTSR